MSKSIVIQESGTAKTLNTISVVETNGDRGGSVDWVPEDECTLGDVTITANGDVKASDHGVYAFSKVVVKVPADAEGNRAVGKDKHGNWIVVVRNSNGILIKKSLPSRIAVVTPPTKTNYSSGEAININGIVVKAYYDDDGEYGTVPTKQLTYSPITATGTTVTVKWKRDGDKQELSTTFNITVS